MTIFNVDNSEFEIYSNQVYFLVPQIDRHRNDFKEVMHLFYKDTDNESIALNNEDDKDLDKILDKFSQHDIKFLLYLDFYREDNFEKLKIIINGTSL